MTGNKTTNQTVPTTKVARLTVGKSAVNTRNYAMPT